MISRKVSKAAGRLIKAVADDPDDSAHVVLVLYDRKTGAVQWQTTNEMRSWNRRIFRSLLDRIDSGDWRQNRRNLNGAP